MQGCQNHCIYCNQLKFVGHQKTETIKDTLTRYTSTLKKDENVDVEFAFYGGTFLNLPDARLNLLLKQAKELKNQGKANTIRVSTTPDSINSEKLEMIKGIVDTVELGIQSLDNNLLRLIGRRYSVQIVKEATSLLKLSGYSVCHQIMTGLPFETFNSFKSTVDIVCELKPDFVRIYPLIVFKDTALACYFGCKIWTPISKEEIIKRIAYGLYAFKANNIKVIRVGLDSFVKLDEVVFSYSDDDWKGKAISFLWLELLKQILSNTHLKSLTLYCSNKDYQHIAGHNKSNVRYFSEIGLKIKILSEDSIKSGICIKETETHIDLENINWSLVDLNYAC